ncbi:MAG: DsrE family protein [Bacteroidia bacterium]|nr:DsrE family protein [Bacteroidia bacterium]
MKTALKLILMTLALSVNNLYAQKASNSEHTQDAPVEVTNTIHKIVFQLTTSDTLAHKALMKQLVNIKTVAPDTKIEVVCHGPGLDLLLNNKTVAHEKIKAAKEKGVEFIACEFSLKERKLDKSTIISEAGFVPAGIIEIVIKQEEGWTYIKSGF